MHNAKNFELWFHLLIFDIHVCRERFPAIISTLNVDKNIHQMLRNTEKFERLLGVTQYRAS